MRTVVVIFDCFGARHCEERSNPGDFGSVVFIVFDLRCIAIVYQNDEKAKKNITEKRWVFMNYFRYFGSLAAISGILSIGSITVLILTSMFQLLLIKDAIVSPVLLASSTMSANQSQEIFHVKMV
jgi:hypothetical protein